MKRALTTILALATAISFTGVSFSQTAPGAGKGRVGLKSPAKVGQKGRKHLQGAGSLIAVGVGSIRLLGSGKFGAVCKAGVGTLKVRGAESIKVKGQGTKHEEGGFSVYTGFKGRAAITGTNVEIVLEGVPVAKTGNQIAIRAQGGGSATLTGTGKWRTQKQHGEWSKAGITVKFEASPAGTQG